MTFHIKVVDDLDSIELRHEKFEMAYIREIDFVPQTIIWYKL